MKFSEISPFVFMTLRCTCGAEIYSRKQDKDIHDFIKAHRVTCGSDHPIRIAGIETKNGYKWLEAAKG